MPQTINSHDPTSDETSLSRRRVLGGLAALSAPLLVGACSRAPESAAVSAASQDSAAAEPAALPVAATFIEHLGTVVPDVAAATTFHSRLFSPAIMREQQNPPLRCYVPLDPGYLAFGSRANAPRAFFDHFCVLLKSYDPAALAARLEAEGFTSSPRFTLFQDPDGAGVQFYQDPGGWFPTVVPGEPFVQGPALVTPHGLEHVMLNVADLAASTAFYRHWFGPLDVRQSADLVWFEFPDTRLGLTAAAPGATPGIDRIRVRVAPFDRDAVGTELAGMGATIAPPSAGEPTVLAFADPVGLKLELVPV